ncbi:GlsB/YeaQ/YmgE family stress response membrane protein [Leptospira sp. GIMC2001]|uniref:GlsB/YeaQ/YmgE family stress response membrane protein n=1 Tax=Leptospira sp. GIMC2001 TaxID=1513297 RepID=UPI00234BB2CB|nr:GlsB/YeaQ/YmgE family stress response membrane protein [Leptospira sp. GIMC2001]WCL49474.1 GlsB/YeaQ/YmgE family stress response membrane protein [Leptospira sp. GIMC2001]
MGSITNLIIFLLIGLLAGWVAAKVIKNKSLGILWNMVVGVIGSFVGSFVAGLVGIGASNLIGQALIAIGGAILLLLIIGFLKKKM